MAAQAFLPQSSFEPYNISENGPEEYSGGKVSLVSHLCVSRLSGNMRPEGTGERHFCANQLRF